MDASIVVRLIDETRSGFNDIQRNLASVDDNTKAVSKSFDMLRNAALGFVAALGSKQVLDFINDIQTMDNRLKLVTKSQDELNATFKGLFDVAQRTRAPIGETVDLYSKLSQNANVSRQSTDDLRKVTEAFTTSLAVSGTSGQAAAGAILQFGQAMASGKLQGDEFRSMAEANPKFLQILADATGIAREELKELASKGFISAEVAAVALKQALPGLQDEMGKTGKTVSQAVTGMANEFIRLGREFDQASGLSTALVGAIEHITKNAENLIPILQVAGVALVALGVYFAPLTAAVVATAAAVVYFADVLGPVFKKVVDAASAALDSVIKSVVGFGAAISAVLKLENPFTAYDDATKKYEASAGKAKNTTDALGQTTKDLGDATGAAKGVTDEMKDAMDRSGLAAALAKNDYTKFIDTLKENIAVTKLDGEAKLIQQNITKALAEEAKKTHGDISKISAERRQQITDEVTALTKQLVAEQQSAEERKKVLDDLKKKREEYDKFIKDSTNRNLTDYEKFVKDMSTAEQEWHDGSFKSEKQYQDYIAALRNNAQSDYAKKSKDFRFSQLTDEEKYRESAAELQKRYDAGMVANEEDFQTLIEQIRKTYYGKFDELAKQGRELQMTETEKFQAKMEELEKAHLAGKLKGEGDYEAAKVAIRTNFGKKFDDMANQQRERELDATGKYHKALLELQQGLEDGRVKNTEDGAALRRKIEQDYRDAVASEYSTLYSDLTSKVKEFTGMSDKEFNRTKEIIKLVFGVDVDTLIKTFFANAIKYVIGFRTGTEGEMGLIGSLFGNLFGSKGTAVKSVLDFTDAGDKDLKDFSGGIPGIFGGLGSLMSKIFSTSNFGIESFISSALKLFDGFGSTLGNLFSGIGKFIGNIFSGSGGGGGILDSIGGFIGNLFGGGGGATAGGGIIGTIGNVIGGITGTIGNVIGGITGGGAGGALGGIGSILGAFGPLGLAGIFAALAGGLEKGTPEYSAERGQKTGPLLKQLQDAQATFARELGKQGFYSQLSGLDANKGLVKVNFFDNTGKAVDSRTINYLGYAKKLGIEPELRSGAVQPPTLAYAYLTTGSTEFGQYGLSFNRGAVSAMGGLLTRPTMFKTDTGVAIGGEAGTEAILPLSRTSGGELGVSAEGMAPVNITFTINAVDATGIDQLLIKRRSTIVNMVRSAVNEKGRSLI